MSLSTALVNAALVASLTSAPGMTESPAQFSALVATAVSPVVELHSEASAQNSVVGRLRLGDRAQVVFIDGDWFKVRHDQAGEGWIHQAQASVNREQIDLRPGSWMSRWLSPADQLVSAISRSSPSEPSPAGR